MIGRYYNNIAWLTSSSITLDRYDSKIRKVSRCRPTISNENILATRQELFLTKVAPVQSITDIVVLDFWLILLSWMFISSCTNIYFFVNECIFLNVYISVNTIFKCRSFLSKLVFTHTVSYWSCSYEIVEQWDTRLSPEIERTTCLTNCQTFKT